MKASKPKFKVCKVCPNKFEVWSSTTQVCSPQCAIEFARVKASKKEKKQHLEAKKKLKDNDKSFQVKKTQQIFNKWIRLRDEGNNCISCGKPPKKKNAGHFKSRGGFPQLRYEPLNCHLQCEHCNTHLSGNLSLYRFNLIIKIGIDKVEWLEGPHEPKRYTIPELKELQQLYKVKIKGLEQ